jgi:hypothetical protein
MGVKVVHNERDTASDDDKGERKGTQSTQAEATASVVIIILIECYDGCADEGVVVQGHWKTTPVFLERQRSIAIIVHLPSCASEHGWNGKSGCNRDHGHGDEARAARLAERPRGVGRTTA